MKTLDVLRAAARDCRAFADRRDDDSAIGLRRLADDLERKAGELERAATGLLAGELPLPRP